MLHFVRTEYVRAGLLPGDGPAKVRKVLKLYLDQRLLWYVERDPGRAGQLDRQTAKLQDQMWALVQTLLFPSKLPQLR